MAQLEEGKFLWVPRREKWLKVLFKYIYMYQFVSVGSCSNSGAWWDSFKFWYDLEFTWMGFRWMIYLQLSCLNVFSTDWFWQNTAGASTIKREVHMEHQIFCKHWVIRRCWKSWILAAVLRSQQGPGKNCTVPIGRTWRRQISHCAS